MSNYVQLELWFQEYKLNALSSVMGHVLKEMG